MKSAALALVIAFAVYLLARQGLVLHDWFGVEGKLTAPDIIRFQLPDALWQYAFCMTVYAIWRDLRTLALPLALGLFAEATIGTFDPADVVALVAGALGASLQIGIARRSATRHSESSASR